MTTTTKYSRQRESIKEFLSQTSEHPTADTVYMHIREKFPNISLGTVYRNLNLLVEQGEVIKLSTGNGCDRFDYRTNPHYHFVCTKCSSVLDLDIAPDALEHINRIAQAGFDGEIEGHYTYFYGKCPNCKSKSN